MYFKFQTKIDCSVHFKSSQQIVIAQIAGLIRLWDSNKTKMSFENAFYQPREYSREKKNVPLNAGIPCGE